MGTQTHGISVVRDTKEMQVTFNLVEKASEKVVDSLVINWSDVHENCEDFTSLYGLTKVLQDRESGADMMDKLTAYKTCFDETLGAGILARERKSSGITVRIEVEALATIKKISVKQAQVLLRKYDKDQKEVIYKSEIVQAEVAKMAKKAETELDADLLDDLLPKE